MLYYARRPRIRLYHITLPTILRVQIRLAVAPCPRHQIPAIWAKRRTALLDAFLHLLQTMVVEEFVTAVCGSGLFPINAFCNFFKANVALKHPDIHVPSLLLIRSNPFLSNRIIGTYRSVTVGMGCGVKCGVRHTTFGQQHTANVEEEGRLLLLLLLRPPLRCSVVVPCDKRQHHILLHALFRRSKTIVPHQFNQFHQRRRRLHLFWQFLQQKQFSLGHIFASVFQRFLLFLQYCTLLIHPPIVLCQKSRPKSREKVVTHDIEPYRKQSKKEVSDKSDIPQW